MSVLCARIRGHRSRRAQLQPKLASSDRRRGFSCLVAPPAPDDERSAQPQERRGVFSDDVQRREGPGRDQVIAVGAFRPLLRPSVDGPRVRQAARGDPAPDKDTFPRAALDEIDVRPGQRNCKGQPRKPCPGAEVADGRGGAGLVKVERHERIGHMVVDSQRGVAYGRGRQRVGADQSEQGLKPVHRGRR